MESKKENMNFHTSMYNIFFQKDNFYYVFNTHKGNLITLDRFVYDNLKNGELLSIPNDIFSKLLKLGFVSCEKNEFKQVLKENIDFINNSKMFSILISPTLKCNASCSYCFEKGAKVEDMDFITADNVIKYIESNYKNNLHITWFGGEPLLGTTIINYISLKLTERNIKYKSSIITNGFLLDEYIDNFKSWNINNIQITLDGLFEKYDSIKQLGINGFSRVISNIELAIKQGLKVSIRVNYDASKFAIEDLDIVDFLYDKFKNGINIYFHDIVGEEYKTPNEVDENPLIAIYEKLFDYGYVKNIKDMRIKRTYRACGMNHANYINVSPNGNATKCEHFVGKKSIFDIGNLNDNSLNTSRKFPIVRKECSTCVAFPICGGGCYSNHLARKQGGCFRFRDNISQFLLLYLKKGGK